MIFLRLNLLESAVKFLEWRQRAPCPTKRSPWFAYGNYRAITFATVIFILGFFGARSSTESLMGEVAAVSMIACGYGMFIGWPVGAVMGKLGAHLGRRIAGEKLITLGTALGGFLGRILIVPVSLLVIFLHDALSSG